MTKPKFIGKIRTDPWESLAKGPREVMASLWQEYLTDLLHSSTKSGRFRVLRREIEAAAGFSQIFQEWPSLPPEGRAEAWKRLVTAARAIAEETQAACVRCGECCERSSPTLLLSDMPLLEQEVVTWHEVYTLRPGEQATSREGQVVTLAEERLKIRELPGSRQCQFYLAATQKCRIYEQRPEQCRRQNCWGEPAPPPEAGEFLTRAHLFSRIPEVWDLIAAHQERCDLARLEEALSQAASGQEEAGDVVFEALHFDHHLREMLRKEWGLAREATELLLGRPLPEFLKGLGIKATLTPEGVFRLEPK